MSIFFAGWYVIYTMPRHEKKVYERLGELDITSFLPLTKKLRKWHDRRKYVDEPLFPSYIFIYLKDMHNYYRGVGVEGALYYVKTGKEVARVNEAVVNNLKLITNQFDEIETSADQFQPGQQLVIREGALTGLSCEVVKIDNKRKLLVRVDLLRRNVLVTLPVEQLMTT
jgi:transcriptional antiterminator RfaH